MKKVVIIGAGPAGITAAYELAKKHEGYEVTVLEASGQAGGISRTVRHEGNRMDIGGHRFFSKDPRAVEWWYEILKPQGKPAADDRILRRTRAYDPAGADPEQEDEVMLKRQRVSRIYYNKRFFDYPVTLKWETIKNLGVVMTIKAGFSWLHASLFKKPEDNLENFYINRFGRQLYAMFFEGYTEKVWGRHPSRLSADWGDQRVKGLSVGAVLANMFYKIVGKGPKETSLIEEFLYPKYGPGQLWETALKKAEEAGVNVKYNCTVKELRTEGQTVTGVVYDGDGGRQEMQADIVLSAMPVRDLAAALGDSVPEQIKTATDGLPYRDFMTVGLLVPRLLLKNNTDIPTCGGLVPDCWIYVQDTGVRLGRIQIFNNWSPYMVKDFQHRVWIGLEYFCQEGDSMWNTPDREFAGFAAGELEQMGIIRKEDVLDYHVERVAKAYPAYFDTYDRMDEIREWLDGYNNLFCIGRNGQHRYNNMDHSMITAFEAVEEITGNTSGKYEKSHIWNVNTEKEYHEESRS